MQNQKREVSQQAQVSKLCKAFIKDLGYKCSVRSSSFSMGDSVSVELESDIHPKMVKEIETYCNQFQYGHFDGMNDIYENSNSRGDIPQTKYMSVTHRPSTELRQKAWDLIRSTHAGYEEAPELLEDASCFRCPCNTWAPDMIYRVLRAQIDDNQSIGAEFWEENQAQPTGKASAPAKRVTSSEVSPINSPATIEEHTHTKKDFQMFIVVLGERVSKDNFKDLLASARSLGGWYSREWGTTPGGFAFKSCEKAQEFIELFLSGETPPDNSGEKAKPVRDLSERLSGIAEKMDSVIEDKFRDREENTAKRIAQAAHARLEGYKLQRTQNALYALAELHSAGNVPKVLQGITSKKAVYECMGSKINHINNGYHGYTVETGEPSRDDDLSQALWSLLKEKSPEDIAADELKQKLAGVSMSKIEGYFPTPDSVIDQMLEIADISPLHSVLEPSAGDGAIVARLPEECITVVFEVNHSLCEILKLRGFDARYTDFMQIEPQNMHYDRVLMNPPFEKLQDAEHVQHAYKFLKPGGRLVAIMSPSAFQNSTAKAQAFREWFEEVGGIEEDLPEGSFKESGTGVNTKIIVIDKG